MHLEIEMVDATLARFCSQFIVSLFRGLQHGKFRIEERWSKKQNNLKRRGGERRKKKKASFLLHKKYNQKKKSQRSILETGLGEMWIIFLHFSFSRHRLHHPLHHHRPLPLHHHLPLHQYHPDLPRHRLHPLLLLPHPPCLGPSSTVTD